MWEVEPVAIVLAWPHPLFVAFRRESESRPEHRRYRSLIRPTRLLERTPPQCYFRGAKGNTIPIKDLQIGY